MKYRVIGWVGYDDLSFEDEDTTDAAMFAIIDDILQHDYCFSGYDHQEMWYGAPVLNDGKRRCFSQRTFGAIMATAKGCYGPFDYSLFTFGVSDDARKMPDSDRDIDPDELVPETDLEEAFSLDVASDVLQEALGGTLTLDDLPTLRYIDEKDTLTLTANGASQTFTVTSVSRQRDETEKRPFKNLILTLKL